MKPLSKGRRRHGITRNLGMEEKKHTYKDSKQKHRQTSKSDGSRQRPVKPQSPDEQEIQSENDDYSYYRDDNSDY
jgi:hypothetical protein